MTGRKRKRKRKERGSETHHWDAKTIFLRGFKGRRDGSLTATLVTPIQVEHKTTGRQGAQT